MADGQGTAKLFPTWWTEAEERERTREGAAEDQRESSRPHLQDPPPVAVDVQ